MSDDIVNWLRKGGLQGHNEAADEIERLRAELAAVSKERDIAWRDKLELMHERDELRALLREAREQLWLHGPDTLCARIDAALNKGGGDE